MFDADNEGGCDKKVFKKKCQTFAKSECGDASVNDLYPCCKRVYAAPSAKESTAPAEGNPSPPAGPPMQPHGPYT